MSVNMAPRGNHRIQLVVTLLLIGSLAGCGVLGQASPTPLPTIMLGGDSATPVAVDAGSAQESGDGVVASGIVVPAQQAQLAFTAVGTVQAVNVRIGDRVKAGQALAALNAADGELAVEQAKAEFALAQGNYDIAHATQSARAQASIAAAALMLQEAQSALENLKQNAALVAAEAQLALANAQEALDDAQRVRTNMNYPRANQTTIDGAQAFYDLEEDELQQAKEAYDRVRSLAADNPERSRALLNLSNAQKERDKALITLNWYQGKNSQQDIAQAEAQLVLAQVRLQAAQQKWADFKGGPSAADLSLAEARIASAQAQLDLANAVAATDGLALVQAQLDAAGTHLQMAQAQLSRMTITAPFAGTIASLHIHPGEWVMAGQPVLALLDTENLRIQTTDLSERDVPRIAVGQPVTVFIKALNQSVPGRVSEISPFADTLGGDVVYTTLVDLDEPLAGLRSGMSAEVQFEIDG